MDALTFCSSRGITFCLPGGQRLDFKTAATRSCTRVTASASASPHHQHLAAGASAAGAPKGFSAREDGQDRYRFFYMFRWQEVVVQGQDVVFKDVIEPLESVSVNVISTEKTDVTELGPSNEGGAEDLLLDMRQPPVRGSNISDISQPNAELNLILGIAAGLLFAQAPATAADLSGNPDLLHHGGGANAVLSLALGPMMDSPFWDNVGRFIVYFFTVFTGGLFSIVRPIYELGRNPVTVFLLVVFLGGGVFLTYLTLSAMLGLDGSELSP